MVHNVVRATAYTTFCITLTVLLLIAGGCTRPNFQPIPNTPGEDGGVQHRPPRASWGSVPSPVSDPTDDGGTLPPPGTTDDGGAPGTGGPPGNALEVYNGGTRIKMLVGTTPDGAKMFVGWHDMDRSLDCAFDIAADGKRRCLPVPTGAQLGQVFSDTNCVAPLAVIKNVTGCVGPAPAYVMQSTPTCTGGPAGQHVYPLGPVVTGGIYFWARPGQCATAATGNPDPTAVYYTVGPEVPSSYFQEMTVGVQ